METTARFLSLPAKGGSARSAGWGIVATNPHPARVRYRFTLATLPWRGGMSASAILGHAERRHRDRSEPRAMFGEADRLGAGRRQVDDPAGDVRAAIVDAHDHGAAVGQVGDLDQGAERQRLVSRREIGGVGVLAVRGRLAAVDRSDAELGVAIDRRRCWSWRDVDEGGGQTDSADSQRSQNLHSVASSVVDGISTTRIALDDEALIPGRKWFLC